MPVDLEICGLRVPLMPVPDMTSMKRRAAWTLALALLALSASAMLMPGAAYAAEECVSDNPAVTAMRSSWDRPREAAPESAKFNGAFDTVHTTLQPYDQAAARYGQLALGSKKDIKYFAPFVWSISREGDYWIAADSGVWIDVFGENQKALEPLTFNHGLRCAGIFKALKFHLTVGTYRLLIASENTDSIKFASKPDGGK